MKWFFCSEGLRAGVSEGPDRARAATDALYRVPADTLFDNVLTFKFLEYLVNNPAREAGCFHQFFGFASFERFQFFQYAIAVTLARGLSQPMCFDNRFLEQLAEFELFHESITSLQKH